MFLKVGTEYRVIRDNNGTIITLASPFSANTNGKPYTLWEAKTVINAVAAGEAWNTYGLIAIDKVGKYAVMSPPLAIAMPVQISNFKLYGNGAGFFDGVDAIFSDFIAFVNIQCVNVCFYGFMA